MLSYLLSLLIFLLVNLNYKKNTVNLEFLPHIKYILFFIYLHIVTFFKIYLRLNLLEFTELVFFIFILLLFYFTELLLLCGI